MRWEEQPKLIVRFEIHARGSSTFHDYLPLVAPFARGQTPSAPIGHASCLALSLVCEHEQRTGAHGFGKT